MMKRARSGESYSTQRRIIRENSFAHVQAIQEWLSEAELNCTTQYDKPDHRQVSSDSYVCLEPTEPLLDPDEILRQEEVTKGQELDSSRTWSDIGIGIDDSNHSPDCSESDEEITQTDYQSDVSSVSGYSYAASDCVSDKPERLVADIDDQDLSSKLAVWATEFSINHVALRQLLSILIVFFPHLPRDPRTLLATQRHYAIKEISGGLYHHFGIAKGIIEALGQSIKQILTSINIQVNIDGLPLFKSSKTQFWPILGRIVELERQPPFIIGLYSGEKKPDDIGKYLHDFVEEMKEIQIHGVPLGRRENNVTVSLSCFICDAPARAFVKQIKGHNAYHGCEKCTQRGTWNDKVTFPETGASLRTDVSFNEMADSEHHLEIRSPLCELSIGMISQFVLDPMHLVYLGVTRKLIWLWMKGPVAIKCRIGGNNVRAISEKLLLFHEYIPREFQRKCRSLAEIDRWKATEFRQFILYSGVIALKKNIPDVFYQHYLLLFISMYCFSSPIYWESHCEYASQLLLMFVNQFSDFYGQNMLVYNVHNLVHLAADVKRFGPLDSFAAFPFESFLGKIKKLLRKPNSPLAQVIRRLSEYKGKKSNVRACSLNCPVNPHHLGPLPLEYGNYSQFTDIQWGHLHFSTRNADNCVRVGNQIAIIKNIIKLGSDIKFLYEPFNSVSEFFNLPLKSSDLGIHKVSDLAGSLETASFGDITRKYIRLPCCNYHVVIPLLHQFY